MGLLSQVYSASGFFGGLKKLKPKNIVKAVQDKAPQAAQTLKEKTDVLRNTEDATKVIEKGKDKALETVAGASSSITESSNGVVPAVGDSKVSPVTTTIATTITTTI